MFSEHDDPQRDPFTYQGRVVDVSDPLRRHRIRAEIHGVTSKTAWAYPRNAGGPQRGGHVAPKLGDGVLISYLGGDTNRPLYEPGWWGADPAAGTTELPKAIADAGGDAALVQAFEAVSGDAAFRVTLDERPGQRAWRVEAVRVVTGQPEAVIASIELDLEKNLLDLFGMGGVQIRSLGFIDATALIVRLLRRRVGRSRRPI